MTNPEQRILLGIVGGAHGLKGECRVSSFTAEPTDLGAYGPLFDARGRRYTVTSARPQKNVVVVRFAEVTDRSEAERLNGTELFVSRDALPEEEEDDDFYVADLVGLAVASVSGAAIGTVIAVHDFGAGDILEIDPIGGPSVMIPFSQAAVPVIDLAAGRIAVEPVAAGLVASSEDEDRPQDEDGRPGSDRPTGS